MKELQSQMERLRAEMRALERRVAELEGAAASPAPVPEELGRRRSVRKKGLLRADYADVKGLHSELAIDISEGGACLQTARRLAQGAKLDLVFESAKAPHPLKIKGEVVRVAELPGGRAPRYLVGVCFLPGDARTQRQLRQFVAALPAAEQAQATFEEQDKGNWLTKLEDAGL